MGVTVLIGAQWGDEGKGKLVDRLASQASLVVRYQGGNNAGHTIVHAGERHSFHLVPSGVLHDGVECALGPGVVIDPMVLRSEIEVLREKNIDTSRITVSPQAHLIMPYHVALDEARETWAVARERVAKASGDDSYSPQGVGKDASAIGTTRRGIGPAYTHKASRFGVRVEDLFDEVTLRDRIETAVGEVNLLLQHRFDHPVFSVDALVDQALSHASFFRGMLADTGDRIRQVVSQGGQVLLEGTQGAMLDLDHGTYPYVTSSSPVAGGACVGSGIGPKMVDRVIGVAKAYVTRVGGGPFPTELEGREGEVLVEAGNEFGTTTGRKRRCGWLDLVALKRAADINGITELAITKLDVLSGFDTVKAAVAYQYDGTESSRYPLLQSEFRVATPVYREFAGWSQPIASARSIDDLPENARVFLRAIEEFIGLPVTSAGVGSDRSAVVENVASGAA